MARKLLIAIGYVYERETIGEKEGTCIVDVVPNLFSDRSEERRVELYSEDNIHNCRS